MYVLLGKTINDHIFQSHKTIQLLTLVAQAKQAGTGGKSHWPEEDGGATFCGISKHSLLSN